MADLRKAFGMLESGLDGQRVSYELRDLLSFLTQAKMKRGLAH
jgi:hypothetical protein